MKRNPRNSRVLIEPLDQRLLLSVITLPTGTSDAGLRNAIAAADSNAHATNTINLGAGTFELTNIHAGALVITDANSSVATKTLIISGTGTSGTVIAPSGSVIWSQSIIQIYGSGTKVELENLTIKGGHAINGGLAGGTRPLAAGF